ncbi:MAG TPA: hypothetical protein VNK95_20555 [Caldilineaceae bacterium]|nr:hypothetical protein [Caldilineaceae bacterium]
MRRLTVCLLIILSALAVGQEAPTASAQAANRAGLVIVHGDGAVVTRCVAFEEKSISGYELLARSGLDLRMEVASMGPAICRLDQEGCDEGEACFCQCQSGPCLYWTYWRQVPAGDAIEWQYSSTGAGNTQVSDGMVEGWVWGESTAAQDATVAPPPLRFEEVCSGEVVSAVEQSGIGLAANQRQILLGIAVVAGLPAIAGVVWWLTRRARRQA